MLAASASEGRVKRIDASRALSSSRAGQSVHGHAIGAPMTREELSMLRDAIDTVLTWPDVVRDQVARWLRLVTCEMSNVQTFRRGRKACEERLKVRALALKTQQGIAPRCPVLLAAGSTIDISVDALAQAGIVEVLRRPVANTELAAILASCLRAPGAPRE
jgi:hypothetical protein